MYIEDLGFEVKSTSLGLKDIDSKTGTVVGYFSRFGNKDSDGDIIDKGFFAKSIRERGPKSVHPRIKHLLDHDKTKSVAKIMELDEDSTGLRYESKAGRHTLGQDWLKMCEDGLITEHSVGFQTVTQKKEKDGNHLIEGIAWEGTSCSCWGANEFTPIVGFKSGGYHELRQRFEILEKAMHKGKYTDETFTRTIQPELEHIRKLLGTAPQAAPAPNVPDKYGYTPADYENIDKINKMFREWNEEEKLIKELDRLNKILKSI